MAGDEPGKHPLELVITSYVNGRAAVVYTCSGMLKGLAALDCARIRALEEMAGEDCPGSPSLVIEAVRP